MGKNVQTAKENPLVNRSAELHALTRAEEEACYKDLKERALKHCQASVKGIHTETVITPLLSCQRVPIEFVECSKEHNVTVMWTCRGKLKEMNKCLNER